MLSISHGVSIMAEPHPDRGGTGRRYQHVAPDPKGSDRWRDRPPVRGRSSSSLASCRAGFGS